MNHAVFSSFSRPAIIWGNAARSSGHPRFKLHFIPMLSSRLNLVELFFADITRQRMRRCVLTSVEAIKDAIHDYLDRHNADRKPFKWTKSADVILAKTARALAKLYAGKNGNKALEKSSDSAAARLKERSNAISGR